MRNLISTIILVLLILPGAALSTPISSVSTYTVGKADMNGMQVTINFADGKNASATWGQLGPDLYGVAGEDWSLTYNGDDTQGWDDINKNFLFDWTLATTKKINSFTINALPGNTVFDIVFYPELTANSSGGIWYPNGAAGSATSGTAGPDLFNAQFYWEFTDPVNILGQDPLYDLYSTLYIDFTNKGTTTGFTSYQDNNGNIKNFQFIVDTDNVTPVPEPATMLLFGIGLLGMGLAGRKRL
jgi:hypothetical protein